MISYDNYLNRIQKLAKFKNFVHKFRFLFIGLFSLIIAATAGLLIAKGQVTTAMTLPAQIVYGDSYEPTPASAFMSSVSYEYSLEGSGKWSSEKPVKAGKYLARTVTEKAFGKGYSAPVHFEITPREAEFTIGATSVVYGDVPANCKVSNLVPGNSLVSSELIFKYNSLTANNTNAYAVRAYAGKAYIDTLYLDQDSVKIVDKNGEDFTSCYKISFAKIEEGVELEVLPRSITIQPKGDEYTYSGDEIGLKNELTEKSLAQLAYGDRIEVENGIVSGNGAPKNQGSYDLEVKAYSIYHGNVDVTDRYNVETVVAQLIINAKKVTITTGSATKDEYDGKAIQSTDVNSVGLIAGHSISAQLPFPELTDAGEIENFNIFTIYDSLGYDVTGNYDIDPVYGTLKIGKRNITVKTGDNKDVYNGEKLFNYEYDITRGSLADGQIAEIDYYGIYNVWESGKNLLALTIWANGREVTQNYDIAYDYGTLTLTPREITIKTEGASREYNGNPLSNTEHSIIEGSLVNGHKEVSINAVSITVAGSAQNAIEYKIRDGYGYGDDVTDNYKIGYSYGTLLVKPRPIAIRVLPPESFVFNGQWQYYNGYDTVYVGEEGVKGGQGLISGDILYVSDYAKIRDVGSVANYLEFYANANYTIVEAECDYGTLTVTARPITVVMAIKDWDYDGTAHSDSSFTTHLYRNAGEIGLLKEDEDKLTLIGCTTVTDAAEGVENRCESYVLSSDNYTVEEIKPGELTVKKVTLNIELSDITLKYGDIIEYPFKGSYKGVFGLISGETVELFVKFIGIKEGVLNPVDDYTIILDEDNTKITKANKEDSTGNYIINHSEATLTIEQLKITVTTGDADKEYDGESLSTEEFTISKDTPLVAGHRAEISFTREIYEVWETADENNDSTIVIYGVDGSPVTDNYDIEYNCGTLTITPRLIFVTTPSQEWVYDATEHSNYEAYTTLHFPEGGKGLIFDDEELIIISFATIIDAGEKDNECIFEVPNSNYYIVGLWNLYGKLKVTPRKIIYYTDNAEKVYDGTPLTCDEYETKYFLSEGDENGNKAGLIGEDKLKLVGQLVSITDVSESGTSNANEYTVPNSNYEIYDSYHGRLTVTVREIVVETGSDEKEYDGSPLSCITYTTYLLDDSSKPGLIEGDGRLDPTKVTYRVNAGSEDNICEFSVPSNNYHIDHYEYGKLTIKPKEITVVISDEIKNVDYGESFAEYSSDMDNFANADTCGLVNGERLRIAVCFMQYDTRVDNPKNAGTYYITLDKETTIVYNRAGEVIENGIYNYDITVVAATAEILRKVVNITIEDTVITYGEGEDFIPEYSFDVLPEDMPYGEQIILGFRYRYSALYNLYNDIVEYCDVIRHVGKYEPYLAPDLCFVVGDDETASYVYFNYTLMCDTATVTVNPKKITVELLDISGVEYGEDYSYPVFEGNYKNELDLPYGDTLTVFAKPLDEELPSVGNYAIKADKDKTLVNDLPDTSDYIIEFTDGNLEIVKRVIIIDNLGAEKVYDGTPLSNGGYITVFAHYQSKPGLLGDDELTLIGKLASITEAGEVENNNRYLVSANYEIEGYHDSMLIIKPRKIVIASEDEVYEYNGEYQYAQSPVDEAESYHYNEITGEKEPALVLDHHFIIGDPVGIKDVGWVYNTNFEGNEIYDGEGNPVTDNYEINDTISGKLIITPRPIVVRMYGLITMIYTGEPHTYDDRDIRTYYYDGETEQEEQGLLGDDKLVLVGERPSVTYVWEGRVYCEPQCESPVGEYGNANYEIVHIYGGSIAVRARNITVEIDNQTKEYDGYPYMINEEPGNYLSLSGFHDLVEGEKLQIAVKFENLDGTPVEKFNVGTYKIVLDTENSLIYKDGEVLYRGIENYILDSDGAILTVDPLEVTVYMSASGQSAVYGEELLYSGKIGLVEYEGEWEELTFEYNYYLKGEDGVLVLPEKLRVGTYITHVDEDTKQVINGLLSNYDIHFNDGIFEITPKPVTITLNSLDSTYGDGEIIYADGVGNYLIGKDENGEIISVLAYDDTLEVFVVFKKNGEIVTPKNAGKYEIAIAEDGDGLYIIKVNGSDDSSDYVFEFISGTLTVEKRGITLELNEPERNYVYGEIYTYGDGIGNYESAENLAYDEQLEVVVGYYLNGIQVYEPKNAGTYDVIVIGLVIYDEFRHLIENGSNNYYVEDIENAAVQLTVERKRIKLEVDDSDYIYGFEAPEITFTIYDFDTEEKVELLPFGEVFTFDFFYTLNGNVVKPENAGEYIIRTSVDMAYINGEREGVENYLIYGTRAATLTIHARKIVVETNTSSHEYDGNAYSDTFVKSYFYNEYDPEDTSIDGFINGYQPEIDEDSVPTVTNVSEGRVANEFGFTVSDNYEIVGEIGYGEIWITQRALTVTLYTGLSIIYGEKFNYPVFDGNYISAEGLLAGETLRVSPYLSVTKAVPDVGEYEIKANKNQTLINGELYNAATSDYDLEFVSGWLTITVRRIVITTDSKEWEYDGEEHSWPHGDPENSYYLDINGARAGDALVEGHKFEAGSYPTITNVGSIPNNCYGGDILDADDNPVTDNYEIDIEGSGTLTVYARIIKVKTGSAEKVYDGDALFSERIEITENFIPLIHDYKLEVWKITNVDESYEHNNFSTIWIHDVKTGEIVTDNYDIRYDYGTLTVTAREIVVFTADEEWTYNGEWNEKPDDYKTYLYIDDERGSYGEGSKTGLVYSDELRILTSTKIKDWGTAENICTYSADDNYIIKCVFEGTLTVNQRHITVVTSSASKPYDGNPLSAPTYDYTYLTEDESQKGLLGDDKIILDEESIVYVTEVGESGENKLRYTVESDNYVIDGYDCGYLEITQRYLIVKTATDDKPYDGTPLENSTDYTVWLYDPETGERTEGGLLGEDELVLVGTPASITEVGWTDNECTYKVPNDNYYLVQIEYGTLTIDPAPLTIVLNDVADVDYGNTFEYSNEEGNYSYVSELANDNETLVKVAVYYADADGNRIDGLPKNTGEYRVYIDLENTIVGYAVDMGLKKGIGNYDVTCAYKTASINKLTLNISLNDRQYEYNGEAYRYERNDFNYLEGKPAYEETLMISVYYFNGEEELLEGAPTDAGNYKIALNKANCLIDGAIDANTNYIILCEGEEGDFRKYDFIITPAKYHVVFEDAEHTYDGEEYDYTKFGNFKVEGLYGYDHIEFEVKYYLNGIVTAPVNAGEYEVELDTDSINFIWGNSDNYEFDGTAGKHTCTLTINPRPIMISVESRQVEYTNEVNPEDESYISATTVAGSTIAFIGDDEENAGAYFYYAYPDGTRIDGVPKDLGTYNIFVEFENKEVIDNYKITLTPGKLTIVGRKVTVTPFYVGAEIEYTGEEVNIEALKEQGLLGIYHVHETDGGEDGEQGFSDEDFANIKVIYEFYDAEHNVRYRNGDAPINAGNYYLSVRLENYDTDKYEVDYITALDFFVIRPRILNVTSVTSTESVHEYDKQAPQVEIVSDELVPADEGYYFIVPKYLDKDGAEKTSYDVGIYKIAVKIVDNNGKASYNYNIVCPDSAMGTLEITPVTLYIRPQSRLEAYEGQEISLGKSDYEFVDGEGGEHSKLVPGDRIEITPSTKLDPSKNFVYVSITNATVYDESGRNVTDNYKLYYAYNKNVMGSGYSSNSFKGSLEYEIRTIYYRQIVPADQRIIPYDGSTKTIEGDILYEIVEGKGDSLYYTDTIKILSTTIGPQVGEYYNWLKIAVYNAAGKDVSRVYNLVLDNANESFITIGVINVTIEIDPEIDDDALESDGAYFYTAELFEGRRALDKNYYKLEGVMEGQFYEVITIKSNGAWYFALVIYTVKDSGSLTDKSDCYKLVTITKSENLSVDCHIVECHSLTNIQSDITLKLEVDYGALEKLADGLDVENTYDGRPALDSSQYKIEGLLPDHKSNTTVVVVRSNRVVTLAVLITNGKSDRSYYYNLYSCEFPEGFQSDDVNILLVSSIMDIKQDVTISITADLDNLAPGAGLYETFDGRWALDNDGSLYTVTGLLENHTVQIVPLMAGGGVTLAVLIFEAKFTGDAMSGRTDRSYLYNVIIADAPAGANVVTVSSLNEIITDVTISLNITADDLKNGEGVIVKSEIDGRWILAEGTFEVLNNFGAYPFASGIELEIIVDRVDEDSFNLYVIVYQISSSGKRSDRSYLYNVSCESGDENITVIYKTLPLGNEGLN